MAGDKSDSKYDKNMNVKAHVMQETFNKHQFIISFCNTFRLANYIPSNNDSDLDSNLDSTSSSKKNMIGPFAGVDV